MSTRFSTVTSGSTANLDRSPNGGSPMAAGSYCWFLTGSQGLYGPETIQPVGRQSQQIVDQLNESGQLPVPVQWQPVLTDSDAIHRLVLQANTHPHCPGGTPLQQHFSPALNG